MFVSWRLWGALMQPFVAHPLFRRWGVWQPPTTTGPAARAQRWLSLHQGWIMGTLVVVTLASAMLFGPWRTLWALVVIPFALLLALIPLLLISYGTIYGMLSALSIGSTISNEKVQGRYTLLGVTPYGFEGATWALCSLLIHASYTLRWLRTTAQFLYFLLLFAVGIPLFISLGIYVFQPTPPLADTLRVLGLGFALVILMVVDFIQSADLGSLIGMLVPTYVQTRSDTRNNVIFFFPIVQFGSYVLIALVMVGPFLLAVESGMSLLWPAYGSLVIFYLVREFIIVGLWCQLARRLNANLNEMDRFTHVGLRDESLMVILSRTLLGIPQPRTRTG